MAKFVTMKSAFGAPIKPKGSGAQVSWALRKTPDGWEGLMRLPPSLITCPRASRAAGRVVQRKGPIVTKGGPAATRAGAIEQAANIADKILENPLVKSALPPGSGTAIKATKLLAKHGPKALKKFGGKGVKRLASALKFW